MKMEESNHHQVKVILHSYMRSGSSLTADVLSHHPGIFYVFEPIYPIYYLGLTKEAPFFPFFPFIGSKPAKLIKKKNDTITLTQQTLSNYLQCRLSDLDMFTLTSLHMPSSSSTLPYSQCIKENGGVEGVLTCLPLLQRPCNSAKGILLKTIRSDMRCYRQLLAVHKNLKLLHLVRDPRATLFSRVTVNEITKKSWTLASISTVSRKFCISLLNDLKIGLELRNQYPNRVAIIMFEDLAYAPLQLAAKIHDFVGLPFTKQERQMFANKTLGKPKPKYEHNLSTDKGNSIVAANRWRGLLKLKDIEVIDKECGHLLYDMLGLLSVTDNSLLQNISQSLRKETKFPFLG